MKNDKHKQNELQRMMEGRAARMIAAAVTVFLCVLTLFEFVALKMEWNVPALAVLSGDNGLWTREYQREERQHGKHSARRRWRDTAYRKQ